MEDEIDFFRSFIRVKNLRNTPEREEIIREIFAEHDHFDVDELYLRLRKKGSRLSKASIYRNIPLIMECGLIRELWHQDGHMHYEHIYGHHHHSHLRCIKCGKIIEFIDDSIKALEKSLEKKYHFRVVDHNLDMTGYCRMCTGAAERNGPLPFGGG